jgi:hypothetical protein
MNDMGNQYPCAGLDAVNQFGQPVPSSPYSRSLSSSPPRGTLTPEQRELKRQRDMARRSSKTRVRQERSSSNSYVPSQSSTPDLDPRHLINYTTSMPAIPAQASMALTGAAHSYIPAYTTSMPQPMTADLCGADYTMWVE